MQHQPLDHADKVGIVVGLAIMTLVIVAFIWHGTRVQQRKMEELWAAARKADKDWSDAMYRYLTSPVKPAKPREDEAE